MAKLVKSVFVRDPARHRDVLLRAGEEPSPQYAALVTNPAAWEDGKPPTVASFAEPSTGPEAYIPLGANQETPVKTSSENDDSEDGDKPAAPKKAANRPARGRKAAGEGSSG